MNKLRLCLFVGAIFLVILAPCSNLRAQNRVFVSGLGDDTNPCTRTLPCRNFQRGHDAVVSGGEVVALDSAGYGKLVITKSVTITGEGVYAGITAAPGNGIRVLAQDTDTVTLRSLSILGQGLNNGPYMGIDGQGFNVLHIENCIVGNFSGDGLFFEYAGVHHPKIFIKNSLFKNNLQKGIELRNEQSGTLTVTIEGTRLENNGGTNGGDGILSAGVTVTVRDCVASGNTSSGFVVLGGVMNIETSVASDNSTDGILMNGGTVRVSNSTVTSNGAFGFNNTGGTFESRGNNTVAGNNGGGAQTSGTITVIAGM